MYPNIRDESTTWALTETTRLPLCFLVLLIHPSVEFIPLTALFILPLIVQLSFGEETLSPFSFSFQMFNLSRYIARKFSIFIRIRSRLRWRRKEIFLRKDERSSVKFNSPASQEIFFILHSFEKKTSILIFVNLFAQHFTSPYSCELNFRDETSDSRIRSLTNIELAKQRDDVASNFSLEFSFENSLDIKVFRICKRNWLSCWDTDRNVSNFTWSENDTSRKRAEHLTV